MNQPANRHLQALFHCTAATLLAALAGAAAAVPLSFAAIDVPGQALTFTRAIGINDTGQIVGDTSRLAFVDNGGAISTFAFPGSVGVGANGINASGLIVGDWADAGARFHGYSRTTSGVFTTIDVPGATNTFAEGVNAAGQIVGTFSDATGVQHGFIDIAGVFTALNVPGAFVTNANGISTAGVIVGEFIDGTGRHGFIDTGGSFTRIDVPGATETNVTGISADGTAFVGNFSDAGGLTHGFFDRGGLLTPVDIPGASFTTAFGINNAGLIVGAFGTGTTTFNDVHGFVAEAISGEVSEPSTVLLLGLGLGFFALSQRIERPSRQKSGVKARARRLTHS